MIAKDDLPPCVVCGHHEGAHYEVNGKGYCDECQAEAWKHTYVPAQDDE